MAVALALGPLPSFWKIVLRFMAAVVPLLTFYAVSRRFEYESDRIAVEAMKQGGMATQALTNLYARVGFPPTLGLVAELLSTHPSLNRRVARIEKMAIAEEEVVPAGSF
jgi:Zn-dependent protease with chaperone function